MPDCRRKAKFCSGSWCDWCELTNEANSIIGWPSTIISPKPICRGRRCGHGRRHRQSFVLAGAAVCTLMGVGGHRAFEAACQQASARYVTQEMGGDCLFALKGNQSGILEKAERLLAQQAFPPEDPVSWEKRHGRLEHRLVIRVAVTPEAIGLTGCWQVLAVKRQLLKLNQPLAERRVELGCYAAGLTVTETTEAGLSQGVRDHWSAIENGVHHRRDTTFAEDACRTAHRTGAEVLATLRNLAIGAYELVIARGRTQADSLKNWLTRQTFTSAGSILQP